MKNYWIDASDPLPKIVSIDIDMKSSVIRPAYGGTSVEIGPLYTIVMESGSIFEVWEENDEHDSHNRTVESKYGMDSDEHEIEWSIATLTVFKIIRNLGLNKKAIGRYEKIVGELHEYLEGLIEKKFGKEVLENFLEKGPI